MVLCAAAAWVIMASFEQRDFAHHAYWVQDKTLNVLAIACLAAAVLMTLIPALRNAAARHVDRVAVSPRQHWVWLCLAYIGYCGWMTFIRYCQYRLCGLPEDSAQTVANSWIFLHHGTLDYPLWGMKALSQHFALHGILFAPTFLLWDSPFALFFAHNAVVCAIPFLAYALVYRLTSSALASTAGLILGLSSPWVFELIGSSLYVAPLPAFFLLAMLCLHYERWILFAVAVAATLAGQEQVPFIYAGLGLYAIYALRRRRPWNWVVGLSICAASVAAWHGELSLIQHYASREPEVGHRLDERIQMFAHLAPKGMPVGRILGHIVFHPWQTLRRVFSSIYTFYPLARLVFTTGFLSLFAPEILPFLTTAAPHVLANASNPNPVAFFNFQRPNAYYGFTLQYSAYVLGPLLWAMAHGVKNVHKKLAPRGLQSWLLVLSLLFAAPGFKLATRILMPKWRPNLFYAMPEVTPLIPPKARVWSDEFLLAPVSNRRWLRWIGWGPEAPMGWKASLFAPDYVMMDKVFVTRGKPPFRDQMLTFLSAGGYRKIADAYNVILIKSPRPDADPDSVPKQWITLPPPDPRVAEPYARYLMSAPPERP